MSTSAAAAVRPGRQQIGATTSPTAPTAATKASREKKTSAVSVDMRVILSARPGGRFRAVDIARRRRLAGAHRDDVVVADVRWYLDGRSGSSGLRGRRTSRAPCSSTSSATCPTVAASHRRPPPAPVPRRVRRRRWAASASATTRPSSPTTTAAAAPPGGWCGCCGSTGHDAALLDGGLAAAWPGPVETGPSPAATGGVVHRRGRGRADRVADADEVAALGAVELGGAVLDARAADRYRGEHRARRSARRAHPRRRQRALAGQPRPGDRPLPARRTALRARFERARRPPGPPVVAYCGSGVSACANLLALERAGITGARLYVGVVVGLVGRPRAARRHRRRHRAASSAACTWPTSSSAGAATLRALRGQRRRNRVRDLDWFEAAYRAYLTGIVGLVVVLVVSSWLGDSTPSPEGFADLLDHGPAAIGLVAAAGLALGLRSGSRGGPLAVEPAEVRYTLLSPVDRRVALIGPAAASAPLRRLPRRRRRRRRRRPGLAPAGRQRLRRGPLSGARGRRPPSPCG